MEDEKPSAPSERPAEPQARDDVHVAGSQVRCPFCHGRVEPETDDWSACQRCLARHHQPCWSEHGRCGSCAHDRALTAAASVATPPRATRSTWQLRHVVTLLLIVVVGSLLAGAVRHRLDVAEDEAREARTQAALLELRLFRETIRDEPRPGPGAPLELTSGGGPQRAVFERGVLVRDAKGRWAVAFRRPDGAPMSLLFGGPEQRVVVDEGQVLVGGARGAGARRTIGVEEHAGHVVEVGATDHYVQVTPDELQGALFELERGALDSIDLDGLRARFAR